MVTFTVYIYMNEKLVQLFVQNDFVLTLNKCMNFELCIFIEQNMNV